MESGIRDHPASIGTAAAMVLIYPITVIAGPRSLLLLISSLCVGMDVWSLGDATRNILDGLPVLAALAALWAAVAVPPARLARSRAAFVPAATGLIIALILGCRSIWAGLTEESFDHTQINFPLLWVFGGPVAVAAASLARLIRARSRIGEPAPRPAQPATPRVIPRPHVPLGAGQRPVALVPYRRPEAGVRPEAQIIVNLATRSFLTRIS